MHANDSEGAAPAELVGFVEGVPDSLAGALAACDAASDRSTRPGLAAAETFKVQQ